MKAEFEFKVVDDIIDITYTAQVEGNIVIVSWDEDGEEESTDYPKEEVEQYLKDGDWVVQEEE